MPQSRIATVLRYALLSICVLYFAAYLMCVFFRIDYPFQLEWQEGGVLQHVDKILLGEPIYTNPSLEFVPFTHNPFYYYVCALASKIAGLGFFQLRVISFLSSLGCFALIFAILNRETKKVFPAVLSTCIFAATYGISGGWFDIGRSDSLFLFFMLAAVYTLKFRVSAWAYTVGGIFFFLCFLTEQTALFFALPIMLLSVLHHRRHAVFFIGTVLLLILTSTVVLDTIHEGWYSYYVFALPWNHPMQTQALVTFWTHNLFSFLPVGLLLSAVYLYLQFSAANRKTALSYLIIFAGMVGTSYFSAIRLGVRVNVLFSAYAAISILLGLAVHTLLEKRNTSTNPIRMPLEALVYSVCIIQFVLLLYNPLEKIPTEADALAGKKIVAEIAKMKGDVLLPRHGYLLRMADKKSYAHELAISNVLRGNRKEARAALLGDLSAAIKEKRFDAIIIDYNWLGREIEKDYKYRGRAFDDPRVFWPVTGTRTRPKYIYVRKDK